MASHAEAMSSEAPPARSKRQRAERADAEPAPRAQVPLYAPYRALGYVTNGVPFVLQLSLIHI